MVFNKSLQKPWQYAQLGLLLFPLLTPIGSLGLLLALVGTWRQEYKKIIQRPLNWLLAILSGWLVLVSCFAFRPTDAFLGLFNFLPFFGFFAGFSALIQTPAQLRRIAQILVFTSVPVVILGLGQLFWGWATPEAWKGVFGAFGCAIAPKGNPPGRMASVFMYTNLLAGYLVIVFILSLGLWIESFQKLGVRSQKGAEGAEGAEGDVGKRRTTSIQNPKSRHLLYAGEPVHRSGSKIQNLLATRVFLTVAVLGNLVGLILTNSRNAWAIAICAGIAFAIYLRWHWLTAVVGAIASSVLLAAFGPAQLQQPLRQIVPSYFWQRLTDQLYPNRPVVSLRTTQWQFALKLTQQRPWTGWGLRNFQPLYEMQMHAWFGHPHSLYLMLTTETGIPATLLFCGWVLWIFYQGVRLLLNWSSINRTDERDKLIFFSYLVALLACIVFNTVDVTIFDVRLNTLVWIVLSAVAGVIYHQKHTEYT
ncbi:MAG TPA: O-antigen ligase [Leptolyngbyaceae cyanobacterium]